MGLRRVDFSVVPALKCIPGAVVSAIFTTGCVYSGVGTEESQRAVAQVQPGATTSSMAMKVCHR